jgi:hypothetical protein
MKQQPHVLPSSHRNRTVLERRRRKAGKLFQKGILAFGTYMLIAIPESLAVEWFVFSLAEMIVAGIVVAAICKPALPAAAR